MAERENASLEVLWVGEPSAALERLRRRGLRVVEVPATRCLDQVESRAPDLVVLAGDVASSAAGIASELRRRSPGATLPIVVLAASDGSVEAVERRAGIVLRVPDSLDPETIARTIEGRLLQISALPASAPVVSSWRDMDDWLAEASARGSSGILVTSDPVSAVAVSDGVVTPSAEVLRRALRRPKTDEPVSMRFVSMPADRFMVLRRVPLPMTPASLEGASVVVIHQDGSRAGALCRALARAGAVAQALGVELESPDEVAGVAPCLVVVSAATLACGFVGALCEDPRLAMASWLVLDEAELGPVDASRIIAPAASMCAAARALRRRLAEGGLVVGRIESLGAAGWLKEVGRSRQPMLLSLRGACGRVELAVAEGRVKEASFFPAERRPPLAGRAALDALRTMSFGRVLVGPGELVRASAAALAEGGLIESLRRPRTQPPPPPSTASAKAASPDEEPLAVEGEVEPASTLARAVLEALG